MENDLILALRDRQSDPRRFIDTPEAFPHNVYPPVTNKEMQHAETQLGFRLPSLLKRIYLEVGNGGFGPGFGILALNDNGARNYHLSLVDWYLDAQGFSHPHHPPWPRRFVTICNWGDSITSVLDCNSPVAPVLRFNGDQYHQGKFQTAMKQEALSLKAWLLDWLSGEPLFQRGRP